MRPGMCPPIVLERNNVAFPGNPLSGFRVSMRTYGTVPVFVTFVGERAENRRIKLND
jgi:hypothetical protein